MHPDRGNCEPPSRLSIFGAWSKSVKVVGLAECGSRLGRIKEGFRIDLRSQDRDKKTKTGDQSKITSLTRQPKGGGSLRAFRRARDH